MSQLLQPITDLYRFNSELLALGLADLSAEDAVRRWKGGDGSSIVYMTGHLCSSRFGLLQTMGAAEHNPYKELFGAGVGSRDGADYPPLEEVAAGWGSTADKLHAALAGLTDEDAMRPDESNFPTPEKTLRARLAFIAWHETYHVGQIGILRTEMGYPSLRQTLLATRQE